MSDKLCDVCKKNQASVRVVTQALSDWHELDDRVLCDDCVSPTTRKPRRSVSDGLRVKAYVVMCAAVEQGVACGMRRAHKHTDAPTSDDIERCVNDEVMNAICEVFDFDSGEV